MNTKQYANDDDSMEYLASAPLGKIVYNAGYKTMGAVRSTTRLGLHYTLKLIHRKEQRIAKFLRHRRETLSLSSCEIPESQWELIRFVNETPAVTSLLYDLDLMPEQLIPLSMDWFKMLNIAQHFQHYRATLAKEKAA